MRGRAFLALIAASGCLGLFFGSMRLQLLSDSSLVPLAGKWATVEATVNGPVKADGNRMSFAASVSTVRQDRRDFEAGEDVLVQLSCSGPCPGAAGQQGQGGQCGNAAEAPPRAAGGTDSGRPAAGGPQLEEGVRVRLGGSIAEPPSNPGADFDYGLYLRRRGVNAVIESTIEQLEVLPDRRGGFGGLVDAARRLARDSLGLGNWGPATGVLKGMVIGDTAQVPDQVISDFRDSGLLHLMAVSGQNVVLLGFIVLLFCRAVRVPRVIATAIAAAVLCVYVPLTGAGPSIVRAGVVGILGLLAVITGRQVNKYYFLALGAAVILSLNPYSLLDPGFQLSFSAVLAIFLVAPAFSAPLGGLPPLLREGIAISTAVGLVTAPIMLVHFKALSLVTVPANLAAEPVAGPVMLLGATAVMIGAFWPGLALVIDAIGAACTGYVISVAHFFASLPGAVYTSGPPGLLATSGFYCALGAMVALSRTIGIRNAAAWLRRRRHVLLALVLAAVLAAGLACFRSTTPLPPADYTVSFLDVGQGDAELVQVPGGATLLIDGGPGSIVLDRLRESGVDRLDAVFLTHPHADHLDGLLSVLESYQVGAIYDDGPVKGGAEYNDFLQAAAAKGIGHNVLGKGDRLDYGNLDIQVLSPAAPPAGDDANEGSLVLLVSFPGLDILCPGDAEGEVLSTLDVPVVDVLKVSHHGSRDDFLDAELRRLKPRLAVISVGAGNSYGHPAAGTLDKLRRAGAQILETKDNGTIRVSLAGGRTVVGSDR